MKRIDRLIMKARANMTVALILATVERRGAGWTAVAHWKGRGEAEGPPIEESNHTTLKAALEYLTGQAGDGLAAADVPVIVDDIPMG